MTALSAVVCYRNIKHGKTLQAVYGKSTPSTPEWARIEVLLVVAGCIVVDGRRSRIARVAHGHPVANFHCPHPAKEAEPHQVEEAREFLATIGAKS